MKTSSVLLALGAAKSVLSSLIVGRNACNEDNCLRGVDGTDANIRPVLTSRLSDCSSYMTITVTPAAVTTTQTTTVTTPLPIGKRDIKEIVVRHHDHTKSQNAPNVIPAYATYCPDTTRYSSACSCAGITASSTTVATPTITAQATTTVGGCPESTQTACGDTCYDLKTSESNCGACGTQCSGGQICDNGACVDSMAQYKCSNPGKCDSNSGCGGGCGFCHPDATGQGYCVASGTCTSTNGCSQNSDCASSLCLDTCCGKVCDDAAANFCTAPSPKMLFNKLFKKQAGGQNDFSVGTGT